MSVVMGTAGHIDHGKTSLVKALTGTDCDRLKEEKNRGITIELGFAFLPLPDGTKLGIVDVPGHERFIKNMVAGAAGIDFVLMVIAADEGVMPQTREHLEICSLLGIKEGIIALTKVDMVDTEMLDLAVEDVRDSLRNTFFENAPLFPVSSLSGSGLEELRSAIIRKANFLQPRHKSDIFRLPVDRVFTIKGYGTIITGTLLSGKIKPNEEIEVLPSGLKARVKSIQNHGQDVQSAEFGHRISLNLSGLEVQNITKGDVIAKPNTLFPSDRWLLSLTCLKSARRGIRQREQIHFHHGTTEVQAKCYFSDREIILPGETTLAEVRFQTPMTGIFGDHCVIRMFSPLITAAGGIILCPIPNPRKLRKIPELLKNELLSLPSSSPENRIRIITELFDHSGINGKQLAVCSALGEKKFEKALQSLCTAQTLYCYHRDSRSYISSEALTQWKDIVLKRAWEFHKLNPLQKGMNKGWLLSGVGDSLSPQLGLFILNSLIMEKKLITENDCIFCNGFTVELQKDEENLADTFLKALRESPRTPPMLRHFTESINIPIKKMLPILKMLVQRGDLTKINDDLYLITNELRNIKEEVRSWFSTHSDLTPSQFKELSGLTRKYAIPLLEYMDNSLFTIRVGNERKLKGS